MLNCSSALGTYILSRTSLAEKVNHPLLHISWKSNIQTQSTNQPPAMRHKTVCYIIKGLPQYREFSKFGTDSRKADGVPA